MLLHTHTLPLLWQVRYSLLPYILLPDKQVLVKYKEVYIQMQSE